LPIEHVSDTARWVAVHRAMESERPDALFRDPFARRLAGERGEVIHRQMGSRDYVSWSTITRTVLFDATVLDLVNRGEVEVVVNLAAGLDTRPWRLPLPASLRWVDVDYPDVLEYKAGALAGERPACRYEPAPADLASAAERGALLDRLQIKTGKALIITEGLLIYLDAEQVGALAGDIHARTAARHWLTDLASPGLLKIMVRTWGRRAKAGVAPFQFAPAEGPAFFQPFGWREASIRSFLEEARRIHREMPMAWLWRLLGTFRSAVKKEEFRRYSVALLLERQPRP
jgi:methyltransferase (TIGR00027 family)